MPKPRNSDIALIAVVVVLVVVAMLPDGNSPRPHQEETRGAKHAIGIDTPNRLVTPTDHPAFDRLDEAMDALTRHHEDIEQVAATTKPPTGGRPTFSPVPRNDDTAALLPLHAGTAWEYEVAGDSKLASHDRWSMRLVTAPARNQPGLMEMGFDEAPTVSRVFGAEDGSVRLDGLPFVAPRELFGTRATAAEGPLLPKRSQMIEGGVWTTIQHRELIYNYQDTRGKQHALNAAARITSRAHMRGFETVAVPAGRFGAYRIEWLGRVAIKAAGRPVLQHLTVEPYRRETMWVAPGVGIVKRKIDYLVRGRADQSVTFSLVSYTPGADVRLSDRDS